MDSTNVVSFQDAVKARDEKNKIRLQTASEEHVKQLERSHRPLYACTVCGCGDFRLGGDGVINCASCDQMAENIVTLNTSDTDAYERFCVQQDEYCSNAFGQIMKELSNISILVSTGSAGWINGIEVTALAAVIATRQMDSQDRHKLTMMIDDTAIPWDILERIEMILVTRDVWPESIPGDKFALPLTYTNVAHAMMMAHENPELIDGRIRAEKVDKWK